MNIQKVFSYKAFRWTYLIFQILFLNFCSSSQNNTIVVSKDQKYVAPLEVSDKIQKKVNERNDDFLWRTVTSKDAYIRIKTLRNNDTSKKNIQFTIKNKRIPWQTRYAYLQKLISFEIKDKDYNKAISIIRQFQSEFPEMKETLRKLSSILSENEGNIVLVQPGGEINEYESFGPVPELSGKRMYFTSSNSPGGKGGEEILEVVKDGEEWVKKRFLTELNTSSHDSAISVSPDGTELLVFGNYEGSLGNGDIFKSKLTKDGWGKPKNLGPPVNSPYFDSDGFPTPDGKGILFVSDRPGGYYPYQKKNTFFGGETWGNTDIYISFLKEDGTYSLPINLGPTINTPGAERTPFLHPDGRTLYFSSNGFNVGFGGLDLYKSVRLDDTWTNWSEPIHLGKTLNTPGSDWGFKMTASSDKGYISGLSDKDSKNNIYVVLPLPPRAKPKSNVIAIQGTIVDESGNPLDADIEWQNLDSGESLGKLKSKPNSGEFFITLPTGKNYGYFASKEGYFSQSQNIDLSKEKDFQEKEIQIVLTSIKNAANLGKEIQLNNILFKSDSDILDERSYLELDRLYGMLKDNPSLKIEIQGHTSTSNRPESFNEKLSLNRASSVANYLLTKGIESDRIKVMGYGSSVPIYPNDTEENQRKNRRVSFKVLE